MLAGPLRNQGIQLVAMETIPQHAALVLGYSFGCVAALETLTRFPASSAILISPFLELRTLARVAQVVWRSPLVRLALLPFRKRILQRHLLRASGGDRIPDELSRLLLGYSARELCRSQLVKHRTPDQIEDARRQWPLAAPRASVLWGGRDPICRFPDLPWRDSSSLSGAGHFLPWTRTEILADRIRMFCQFHPEETP